MSGSQAERTENRQIDAGRVLRADTVAGHAQVASGQQAIRRATPLRLQPSRETRADQGLILGNRHTKRAWLARRAGQNRYIDIGRICPGDRPCPGSPIGSRRWIQNPCSVGSNPTRGTTRGTRGTIQRLTRMSVTAAMGGGKGPGVLGSWPARCWVFCAMALEGRSSRRGILPAWRRSARMARLWPGMRWSGC
jgi:hypothetical protein